MVGHPLSVEGMPGGVAGQNLNKKMKRRHWQKLREQALRIYEDKCGICTDSAEKLNLHERWEFFWHPEIEFSVEQWHNYAAEKGWLLYEENKLHYEMNGRQVHLQTLTAQAETRLPSLIESGFTPYYDDRGRLRYSDEESLRPYQVLVGMILLCPHCHSIKNLDKIRRLAEQGKFDIEPVLQHYMRVNDVTRQEALQQWGYVRGIRQYEWPDYWEGEKINWTQWVQQYDEVGKPLPSYTPLEEWIARIEAEGIETISPFVFINRCRQI